MTTSELQESLSKIDSIGDSANVIARKHSPAEVIKAGTFQGFTDEEIQGVINFFIDLAHTDETVKAMQASTVTAMNERMERERQAYEDAKARMDAAVQVSSRGIIGTDGFPVTDGKEDA